MKLTVQERFSLMDILPKQSNFVELKILRTLREELDFSEEELQKGKISITPLQDGHATWICEKPTDVINDCKISELAEGIILTQLKDLDMQKKLLPVQMTLYEKFVLAKEKPSASGETETGD